MHRIIVYTDARGRSPLREYFQDLKNQSGKDAKIRLEKMHDYIGLLEERGVSLPKSLCRHFSDKKH